MQRYAEEAVQEHIATKKTGLQDRFFKAKSKKKTSSGRKKTSTLEKTVNTAANTIGREIGKKIVRGLFDILKK